MRLDEKKILARANELYARAKCGDNIGYMAPELLPTIASDQVKCLLTALVEALNNKQDVEECIADLARPRYL